MHGRIVVTRHVHTSKERWLLTASTAKPKSTVLIQEVLGRPALRRAPLSSAPSDRSIRPATARQPT